MPKAKQLTVSIENRPGTLASVGNTLGHAKANAFLSGASAAEGYVQLVVDDVKKAKDALEDAGFSYSEQDVLHIEVPNKPGALGEIARKLAAKNINITSGYATTVKASRKAGVVLGVSDLDEAVAFAEAIRGSEAEMHCATSFSRRLDVAPNFVTRSIPLGGYCYGHASRA